MLRFSSSLYNSILHQTQVSAVTILSVKFEAMGKSPKGNVVLNLKYKSTFIELFYSV